MDFDTPVELQSRQFMEQLVGFALHRAEDAELTSEFKAAYSLCHNLITKREGHRVQRIRELAVNLVASMHPQENIETKLKLAMIDLTCSYFNRTFSGKPEYVPIQELYDAASRRRIAEAERALERGLSAAAAKWKEEYYAPGGRFVEKREPGWYALAARRRGLKEEEEEKAEAAAKKRRVD